MIKVAKDADLDLDAGGSHGLPARCICCEDLLHCANVQEESKLCMRQNMERQSAIRNSRDPPMHVQRQELR